ncbi:UNVERIFIED_ORG: hypothetical protein BDK47_11649 [Anoxybacillus amylolyticus]
MKKYRVRTEMEYSMELNTLEEAEKVFNTWKEDLMAEGVVIDETFVEIIESENDFDDYRVIRKVIAVIDHDRYELGTPREEGFDWDYWAKWQEVSE